jgi:hypothetical protein
MAKLSKRNARFSHLLLNRCELDGVHRRNVIDFSRVLSIRNSAARTARPGLWTKMRARDGSVRSSRFERLLPGGQHKLAFRIAFGTYGAAARALHVSRMTIWRWCHDLSPLPRYVAEILGDLIQNKVLEVHAAQNHLRDFLTLPEKPPRPLSGACAGYSRKPKKIDF